MFPRSLYSWTKSWCSPKTKTKTRFLNVKRNLLATRPTERSASRCAHSPEISSFSYIYTHACVIYIYKRVCLHQTNKEKFVSIREHFGVLGLLNVGSWIDPSVSPVRQIQSCVCETVGDSAASRGQVEGESVCSGGQRR